MEVAAKVMDGIKAGEVKAPKNLFIVYTIIKDSLFNHVFSKDEDPRLTSYREVVRHKGEAYKFSAKDIAKIAPELKIPLGSKGK